MFTTAFTEMFGVEHPISCGGMTAVGTAELIGAVANAGALGFLTALAQPTPEDLVKEIARTRDLTDKPFGVNLTILPTITPVPYDEYRQAIIESDIKAVETAGANPAPHMEHFKAGGVNFVHKATSARYALKAQAVGVDVVSIDGFECAGHPGDDGIGGLVLIPAAAKALDIPIIASGGIATGAGLLAALALGAVGVNMGTRFMATDEAPIHDNVKQQIVANSELDTALIFREFNNTGRAALNSISAEIMELSARSGATFENVAHLASGARGRQEVLADGEMEGGLWWAIQAQGLIDSVAFCDEVVRTIMRDAATLASGKLGLVG